MAPSPSKAKSGVKSAKRLAPPEKKVEPATEKQLVAQIKKPATKPVASKPATPAAKEAPPVIEAKPHEKPVCWIELVKSGTIFIARSNTYGGPSKEYKNRVLEDMLTELIVELQEEIQE